MTKSIHVHRRYVLTSGRIITHRQEPNGSARTLVDGRDDIAMTDGEYAEYSGLLASDCAAERKAAGFSR